MSKIDELALVLDESQERHFTKWPIMGVPVWANPSPVATSYAGEINNMKNWIQQRMTWLDTNIPGTCTLSSIAQPGNDKSLVKVYPNPFNHNFTIQYELTQPGNVNLEIQDLTGRIIHSSTENYSSSGNVEMEVKNLDVPAGIYILKMVMNGSTYTRKIVAQ
jgi:hypothetical protein